MDYAHKTAIVGLGRWGQHVARELAEKSQVVAYSIAGSPETEATARELLPHAENMTVEEIAGNPDIEAVWVASPISTHIDITEHLLNASKNVLVEKPLATTSAEAERLVNLAQDYNVVIGTGYVFLFHSLYRLFKQKVAETGLRTLQLEWLKYGTFNESIEQNLLTHHLSIVLDLLGMPEAGTMRFGAGTESSCDELTTSLHYPDHTVESLISRASDQKRHTIRAELSDDSVIVWSGNSLSHERNGTVIEHATTDKMPLTLEVSAFLERVSGRDTYFPVEGDFGVRVLALHEILVRE